MPTDSKDSFMFGLVIGLTIAMICIYISMTHINRPLKPVLIKTNITVDQQLYKCDKIEYVKEESKR